MISKVKLLTLLSLLFIVVLSCRKTNSERTALEHAYACQDVLGPLPDFSCADAIEVPTTKNGTPVTFGPVGDEGAGSANPDDCDCPWAFGLACQTGNKVGRYSGLNSDGSENSDVVFITFCRDGGLGVIGQCRMQ